MSYGVVAAIGMTLLRMRTRDKPGLTAIGARAERLARGLTGEALQSHLAAHRRLTAPTEMGSLFKALALYPSAFPPPPGFDA